jgi:para-aminobenzoate synthetase component 1
MANDLIHPFYLYRVRVSKTFKVSVSDIKKRLLLWASSRQVCYVLNSNREQQTFEDPYGQFDFVVAAGAKKILSPATNSFEELDSFLKDIQDYAFGYFSYDLKNEIEDLNSENTDRLDFSEMFFFHPEFVITLDKKDCKIEYWESDTSDIDELYREIENFPLSVADSIDPFIQHRISKNEYLSTVKQIKAHIQQGDIYEMNYCMEFYSEAEINPEEIYWQLNEVSPMPFSVFFRNGEHYAACASPERFIARCGNKVISQPMKGTARRGQTPAEDYEIKKLLAKNQKEQSENVMIVDLVRNDLSRTAQKGSVKVKELFGVYTFNQVHQMISTVVSEKRDDVSNIDTIRNAFPMGSMTGAPKIRAMELIEKYEQTKRGLFSGSIGYMSPDGNFDFNVVIRSILYNEKEKYISFMVGSAITANSDEEKEYEECMLKAKAMLNVFTPEKKLHTSLS